MHGRKKRGYFFFIPTFLALALKAPRLHKIRNGERSRLDVNEDEK
jgi:hypothetical protein